MPAYAVRLKPDAVRELGLTTIAARRRACAPTSTATSRPTGPRPTASRSTSSCACRRPRARTSPSSTTCRSPTPRTARRSRWRASPTSCRWSTRTSSSARTCSAARRSTPAREGRPSGDVGADVQKIVKATQLPPGYRFDVGGQTQRPAGGVRRRAGARSALAVIFIYIVLAVAVRQLPAAARDHGLAAAGADRRDAGAAVHGARRSTCSR